MVEMSALLELLTGRRICVLTGAGVSTESGIPDYRGAETARRARNPIKFAEFIGSPAKPAPSWLGVVRLSGDEVPGRRGSRGRKCSCSPRTTRRSS